MNNESHMHQITGNYETRREVQKEMVEDMISYCNNSCFYKGATNMFTCRVSQTVCCLILRL